MSDKTDSKKRKKKEKKPSYHEIRDADTILNEKLGFWKDSRQKKEKAIDIWINRILHQKQKDSETKKERCDICNSIEEQKYMELHHLAGQKHDTRTVTACIECHHSLSILQQLWDKRWLDEGQNKDMQDGFFLLGLYDMLRLKSRKTGEPEYDEYASFLINDIGYLLRKEEEEATTTQETKPQ